MAGSSGRARIIVPPAGSSAIDQLTNSVLDDILYNLIQDLLVKTHREEKIARATTAAIQIEKRVADAAEGAAPDAKPDVRIETESAIYEDGCVLLKGNPLKTTTDILCPRCHLPRLLYPTDGKGSKKPDPSIIYCKKYPYIDKPGYDIYGQTWVPQGPGRGKKKKDMEKKFEASDSPSGTDQRPANVLSFPSATCSKCKRCILVTRLNNHMGSCIGNSGRNASRAAAQKISNGTNGNSHHRDDASPSSQRGTPKPGSLPASRMSSPKKRDTPHDDDDDDSDSDNASHKKKKMKITAVPVPKIKIKTKIPVTGSGKIKKSSFLSVEHKLPPDDKSSVQVLPPKKLKGPSPAKKLKNSAKPIMSSPLKHGREATIDSESSEGLSPPPR